jgi:hypothetical protein
MNKVDKELPGLGFFRLDAETVTKSAGSSN